MSVIEFDSNWFGFPVGRYDGNPQAAVQWAETNNIRCLYTLLPIDEIGWVRDATELGFRLVDVRVEFIAEAEKRERKGCVRLASESDRNAVYSIARTGFRAGSRFYNDHSFDRDRVDAMYENWARQDLEDGQVLVSVDLTDAPTGFVTYRNGTVGLVAVSEYNRHRGSGKALMDAAVGLTYDDGLSQLKVVTQGGNLAAQRTFQKCGFRSSSVGLWLHKWL